LSENKTKTYVIDIDGTICSKTSAGNYKDILPLTERIEAINKLHSLGNTIIYFTARGMGRTNNNVKKSNELFYDFTRQQLDRWGAHYDLLMLGKPSADIYIDDKGINDYDFFN
jgi:ribonucleotide monophosphatase NagD (HAD superfamily)